MFDATAERVTPHAASTVAEKMFSGMTFLQAVNRYHRLCAQLRSQLLNLEPSSVDLGFAGFIFSPIIDDSSHYVELVSEQGVVITRINARKITASGVPWALVSAALEAALHVVAEKQFPQTKHIVYRITVASDQALKSTVAMDFSEINPVIARLRAELGKDTERGESVEQVTISTSFGEWDYSNRRFIPRSKNWFPSRNFLLFVAVFILAGIQLLQNMLTVYALLFTLGPLYLVYVDSNTTIKWSRPLNMLFVFPFTYLPLRACIGLLEIEIPYIPLLLIVAILIAAAFLDERNGDAVQIYNRRILERLLGYDAYEVQKAERMRASHHQPHPLKEDT